MHALTAAIPLTCTTLQQFGKEILADEKAELKYEKVLAILEKASGASYGTGKWAKIASTGSDVVYGGDPILILVI